MKTTGMVRRIDELGRIVIPKEIRKQLMMKEGESISFLLDGENIVLTKFSLLNKLSPVIDSLLDGLYAKYQNMFLVSDLNHILMCSSAGLSTYQRKTLPKDIALSISGGKQYKEENVLFLNEEQVMTIFPLYNHSMCVGSFIIIKEKTPYYMMDESLLMFVKDVIEQEIDACV